jgi:hypothetical protein
VHDRNTIEAKPLGFNHIAATSFSHAVESKHQFTILSFKSAQNKVEFLSKWQCLARHSYRKQRKLLQPNLKQETK